MKKTIYGQDDRVSRWVAERIDEEFIGKVNTLGLEEDGKLIAGVVFNQYTGPGIMAHVAADPTKRWMNRDFLYRAFAYPFIQLECRRVTGLVRVDNLPAQKFDEHLGFKREGVLRQACDDGSDLIVYGMLREECRWLGIRR